MFGQERNANIGSHSSTLQVINREYHECTYLYYENIQNQKKYHAVTTTINNIKQFLDI